MDKWLKMATTHMSHRNYVLVALCPVGRVAPTAGPSFLPSALLHLPLGFLCVAPVAKREHSIPWMEYRDPIAQRMAIPKKALEQTQGNGHFFHNRTQISKQTALWETVCPTTGESPNWVHVGGTSVQDIPGSSNLLTLPVLKSRLGWFAYIYIHTGISQRYVGWFWTSTGSECLSKASCNLFAAGRPYLQFVKNTSVKHSKARSESRYTCFDWNTHILIQ